jgi:hypothetical protein
MAIRDSVVNDFSPVDASADQPEQIIPIRRQQSVDNEIRTDKALIIDRMHPGFATDASLTRLAVAGGFLALHPGGRHDVAQHP